MDQPSAFFATTHKPAATVVIFRQAASDRLPELLMVQRAKAMRFAGGAAVFPGGRVDPADRELAAQLAAGPGGGPDAAGDDLDELAARIAAIRETLEETGLAIGAVPRANVPISAVDAARARAMLLVEGALAPVLAQFGWQIDPQVLVPFARWSPPWDGGFDTRFYLANLGTGAVEIAADLTENTHLFWTSAADALAMADRGEISVIFPTRRNLDRLALFANFAEACVQAAAHPVRTITPVMIEEDGASWLTIPDGLGYPVTRENAASLTRG